ncbi:hypothetical protein [Croceicoccus marinus]|uniref:hypothetical protein n=1 Tax=Croceicoccus marinus TaxID=450378 RepID=UPI0012F83F1E|nr:hypothetical protein [Croceicoccus marinus]
MEELLIFGAVIGSTNCATALAFGPLGMRVCRYRVLPVFGTFEFAPPLFGLWLGRQASSFIAEAAEWLGHR